MELATRDLELRAALFRFVDVVPACRSLDDVARHLRGFLGELPETPPPLSAAMRIADVRAARTALGAAAAAGVKHMAHRFIVGEIARSRRSGFCAALWDRGVASSVDLLGEATVTQDRGRLLRSPLPPGARADRRQARSWPGRPGLELDSLRAAGPDERVGEGLRADASSASRCPGQRRAGRGRSAASPAPGRAVSWERTSTWTWSHLIHERRCWSWSLTCCPAPSSTTGRRWGSSFRPT